MAAAELRENAIILEAVAMRARTEAEDEAAELHSLVRAARQRGWARRVQEMQGKFEDIAWPAVCAGVRIQLAEAKARTVSFADTLVSDWHAFEAITKHSTHLEENEEEDALPVVYREVSIEAAARLSALAQVSRGGPQVRAAIERQRKRCERRLLDAFLFAAALRPGDVLSDITTNKKQRIRQRDQARARITAQALAVLGSASSLEQAWRNAISVRVASAMQAQFVQSSESQKKNSIDSVQSRNAWNRLRSTLLAARSVLCGDDGCGEVRALLQVIRRAPGDISTIEVDACAAVLRAVAGSLEGLGLKSALLELLAAADYEDADHAEQSPPPSVWLDSLARACRRFATFEHSLADQFTDQQSSSRLSLSGRQQSGGTIDSDFDDDAPSTGHKQNASSSEEDAEEVEQIAEVRLTLAASLDEVLADARRSYEAREISWLKNALRCAAETAMMATNDDTAVSMDDEGKLAATLGGVRQDANLESLMSGPLRQGALDPALNAVASALARTSVVLTRGDLDTAGSPALPLAQVRAVLATGGEDPPKYRKKEQRTMNKTSEEFALLLLKLGRDFVYDCALRPSVIAAARNGIITSDTAAGSPLSENGSALTSLLMLSTRPGSPKNNRNELPPAALYDVVFAVLDAEARWRQREDELGLSGNDKSEREMRSAQLRAELGDSLLARAANAVAKHLAFLFEEAAPKARKAFAAKHQPDKLAPTPATVQAADLLRNHATVVAHAMLRQQKPAFSDKDSSHYDRARDVAATLHARWRLALADAVFAKFRNYVFDSVPAISVCGAFVLAKDIDHMISSLTELGCTSTDSKLSQLRENIALFKLEKDQLASTLLHDASLAPENLESLLLKRADAHTRLGGTKRAQWFTKLLEDLELVQSVHQRAAGGNV